jgi:hypothetical protein
MNIKQLQITDDLQRQIIVGRELMSTYDENMMNYLSHQYDKVNIWQGYNSKEEMLCKAVYDYWVYGFTPEQQIYYQLYNKNHNEKKEYISLQSEFIYKARLNAKADLHYLEDKYEAYKLLEPYYKREMVKICSEADYSIFLDFISRHPVFIVKPLGLSNTRGIDVVDSNNYSDKKALFLSFLNIGKNFKYDYITNKGILEGTVLEEIVKQDQSFGIFSPKSVNVVRISTIRLNGRIIIYGPWLKVGVSDDIVVGGARDAVLAGIDSKTGIIYTDAMSDLGVIYERHPVSGLQFKGFQIPRWNELISIATKVANQLKSTINYVGWDFVLTPDKGWVIIEGNYWGQIFKQFVEHRGVAKEFGDLIGWHMEDGKFWWQYKIRQIEKSAGLSE